MKFILEPWEKKNLLTPYKASCVEDETCPEECKSLCAGYQCSCVDECTCVDECSCVGGYSCDVSPCMEEGGCSLLCTGVCEVN